jgi:hypothetical protein
MFEGCGKLSGLVGLMQLVLAGGELLGSCVKSTEFGWMAAMGKQEQMGFHATGPAGARLFISLTPQQPSPRNAGARL